MAYVYDTKQKKATGYTADKNQLAESSLDDKYKKQEQEDVREAKSHIIYPFGQEEIRDDKGNILYKPASVSGEDRTDEKRPDSVNYLLWSNLRNNNFGGVYKMAEGYYAVTGAAVCVIGFIRGETGWIVIDTGASSEESALAVRLVELATDEEVADRVNTVIITHTHYDHFAGIDAFTAKNDIKIIGPAEYEKSLVDDNLYAGVAMSRRLGYQGGLKLKADEFGSQGAGLQKCYFFGKSGSVKLPNIVIGEEKTMLIDGVSLTFIPTPNTETRAHMAVYDNTHKVLALGDNSMGTLHNTYTPRGARTRDASFWGEIFYHLYNKYGDSCQALFSGHGIAQFNSKARPEHIKKYLLDNAVAYKYPSDQALLLANKGVKLSDIGRKIRIPDSISKVWYTRDHYGNYSFNARGAVNRILGFYDGNPVNLNPLEEVEEAKKFVEYSGGADELLRRLENDFEKGEYQWVAKASNYLVMADATNLKARYICADALEQLGYQAHTGLWRNMYLTGALELRNPEAHKQGSRLMSNDEVIPYVEDSLILDYLAINFDGEEGLTYDMDFAFEVVDNNFSNIYRMKIYKGTILYDKADEVNDGLLIRLTRDELYSLAEKKLDVDRLTYQAASKAGEVLEYILEHVVDFSAYADFNIIEPLANI